MTADASFNDLVDCGGFYPCKAPHFQGPPAPQGKVVPVIGSQWKSPF